MTVSKKELLRSLPSVSEMLEQEEVSKWIADLPRSLVVTALRVALDDVRKEIQEDKRKEPIDGEALLGRVEAILFQLAARSLNRVVNATGIVLHTGLGRAPLCAAAIDAIVQAASGYCNLEYELESGQRGRRVDHVAGLLTSLSGAEAATVANNNAAATLLILQTFAAGRDVIVSRGQLIEIGGSFRLPDIMSASGARLREVGTTNRTRLGDYEGAVGKETALLLHVHTSNYRVVGFTEQVEMGDLVRLARKHELLAVDDLGSGLLLASEELGLPPEPSVRASVATGADLVCFSGDKLLGGPQCGVIVGKTDLIRRIEANPLMRTYRVGKLTLLALEATLRCYLDEKDVLKSVPTLAMLTASTERLAGRAQVLADRLTSALPDERFYVCSDVGYAGGGSLPGREMQTVVVQWRPGLVSTSKAASRLRDADVPVVARIRDDAICFDLRTVSDQDFEAIIAGVSLAVCEGDRPG